MGEVTITVKVCDFCKPETKKGQPKKATRVCSICGTDLCKSHVAVDFSTDYLRNDDAARTIDYGARRVYPLLPALLCPSCATAWRNISADTKKKLIAETLEKYRPIIATAKL